MDWIASAFQNLAEGPIVGYGGSTTPSSEPTALAALALLGGPDPTAARPALDWLSQMQQTDGSVGVRPQEPTPTWPTALAVIAWSAAADLDSPDKAAVYRTRAQRGINALMGFQGLVYPPDKLIRHNSMLAAWPWVEGTHAWVEPTALNLMALKATGAGGHPRAREAVEMLFDRQLPQGGCNYGNKIVLGQVLRPHIQPTGMTLAALGGESDRDERLARSAQWLAETLNATTAPASLAWSLLGLAAHGRNLPAAASWLESAWAREAGGKSVPETKRRSGHKTALLVLAGLGTQSPILRCVCSQSLVLVNPSIGPDRPNSPNSGRGDAD